VDQIDLLQEQVKMLAGEAALCTSSLKRLSEQAATNPDDLLMQVIFSDSSVNKHISIPILLHLYRVYFSTIISLTAGAN
jgi:hypothetical protein